MEQPVAIVVVRKRFSTPTEVLGGLLLTALGINAILIATDREPISTHAGTVIKAYPVQSFVVAVYLLLHFMAISWLRWCDPLGLLSTGYRWLLKHSRSTTWVMKKRISVVSTSPS